MSSALAMFRKSNKDGDIKKSAQKVSDPKKDALTRLKHLRQVLDNYTTPEAKDFFNNNYSHIYYIFNDNFASVEADLKQRANKAHREELEGILHVFEKILVLLPELVHKRWMFHSIGRIMKKLLHPGNVLKIRKDGMRLFLIWYQILQDNASQECHDIFLQLVPGLGDGIHQEILNGRQQSSGDSYGGIIAAGEIIPILPSSGEKFPENITKHFFDSLIYYMVSELTKIEWLNKEMRESSFVFLFSKFKTSYLSWLLPDFNKSSSIYEPILELPTLKRMSEMKSKDLPANVAECRYSFIKWLAHFVLISRQQEQLDGDTMDATAVTEEDPQDMPEHNTATAEHMPGSNASTLSTASHSSDRDSIDNSLCYEEFNVENDIVRTVFYSTRENVNIIHESLRQAFLFTFRQSKAIRTVIGVYKDWFQHADQKPIFMQEPSELLLGQREPPEFHHSSLSDIVEEDNSSDESAPYSKDLTRSIPSLESSEKPRIRNASYLGAINDLADGGDHNQYNIRAGIQKVLQIFIVSSANIFLLETDDDDFLYEQVDLCKKVLNIYRFLVMNVEMDKKTWEKILEVLLSITSGVLKNVPSHESKSRTLGRRLATPIFQTVIVTWIKGNLKVFISSELWDQFLQTLSSLTMWPELIREWAKTMETLTRVLAKQVYNLDLHDLPLQRLSEQKEKRRRGRSQDIPKNKVDEKSFSRGWSKNEPQGSADRAAIQVPFERGVKYKSDGAGGSKSRPDLSKQRSLSGEPSPSHSRQPSNASDSALYIRSSSDGNIASPANLAERLKGMSLVNEQSKRIESWVIPACSIIVSVPSVSESLDANGADDLEVAKITMSDVDGAQETLIDYSITDSISLEKSETDNTYRISRSPSPMSMHSKSRSPSPVSELAVHRTNKDCPTPDRDSLHIEMVATSEEVPNGKESLEDLKSVLAGGTVQGWMPDVAVVLWRRMLGSLGNINKIDDAENHATVYEELNYLLETLIKTRENLGVTTDNMSTPPPPDLIPPIHIFSPWLFECLNLPIKFKRGKLLAFQLLCQMTVQRHCVPLPSELLSQFFMALHQGFGLNDQDVTNVLVKHCGSSFFSMPLSGSTLLLNDFIHAAGAVISSSDLKESPRTEAISVLGSLVCFPNHFFQVAVLNLGELTVSSLHCNDFKERVANLLIRAGKKEPAGLARCVAISALGLFIYEELTHETLHPKLTEAVIVLLGALRCINRMVAKVASDVLNLLCDHTLKLLNYHPELPKRIIEVVAATVAVLIPVNGSTASEEEKKLIISMMFCMIDWCMRMPIHLLLETTETDKSCIFKVFQVLDTAVKGHTTESLQQAYQTLNGMIQDSDFDHLQDLRGLSHRPSVDSFNHTVNDHFGEKTKTKAETDTVSVTAKMLISHVVNHLCHFPMGAGASRLSSLIQEHHDNEEQNVDDLSPDIFYRSNIQFFVQNKRTLISFIELPALLDVPGGGVTAGLTTAQTVCRAILRDLTGKYSWESSVLYAPPWCKQGSSINNAKALLEMSTDGELEPLIIQEEREPVLTPMMPLMQQSEMPVQPSPCSNRDKLNVMLQYIGDTSPECHLIPGEPLNIEAPIPEGFSETAEDGLREMVIQQKQDEIQYYCRHKRDKSMLAKPQIPTETQDSVSAFQMCRMLLDQMGLMAWEKRCQFDLLKKSDKLLRELKHLDNQKCRETHKFAVIYVAEGQEDKNSILSNSGASKGFEDFVSGLGWEVELETHQGFLGGLQQNRTTGDTAPYYANSLCECIFHVSTRMPSGTDEARHIKMRHLGNDEVHVVWSEHTRDYRRGIIPTEFGDVLIIIYPLPSGLYRIQINRKPEVPYFGPLFTGAILDRKVLPGLVRATAINASRARRSLLPFYHSFYEERAKCFDTVIEQHLDMTMFEDFAASIFAPVLPPNSTISDQNADVAIPNSTSSVSLEQQAQHIESVSPPTGRQSRGSDSSLFERTAKRLSLKSRKASKSSHTAETPESPETKNKKH